MISVLLLHLLSTFSLSQALLSQLSPLFFMAFRMLAGGALVLGALVQRKMQIKIEKNHWFDFAQVIICALLVPYYLRYWALSVPSTAANWYFSGLFITYLLSIIFTIEAFTIFKSILITFSYGGLYLVLGFPHILFGLPEALMIASVISFSYGWIIIRRLIVGYAYDPILVNGITMCMAGIISASMCAISEPLIIKGDIIRCILLLITVVLISNVMVHTRYMATLKYYSLTFIQLCSFIIPCWRLIWSGNSSLMQLAGIAIIISCCGLFYLFESSTKTQRRPVH